MLIQRCKGSLTTRQVQAWRRQRAVLSGFWRVVLSAQEQTIAARSEATPAAQPANSVLAVCLLDFNTASTALLVLPLLLMLMLPPTTHTARPGPPDKSPHPLCAVVPQVLPTQLVPDDEGKILRVRLIMKEGKKLFDPVYLFDEGSTVSWIPCGRKLTCSFPGIKFYYGPDTWYGEDVSVLEMDGQFDKLEVRGSGFRWCPGFKRQQNPDSQV